MLFYMQSSVIEKGLKMKNYKYSIIDIVVGCTATVVVAFFIIVACASTLHKNGIQINEAKDAALALKPLAGAIASQVFAFGLFIASIFSATILPLATAFYISEAFGFEAGIDKMVWVINPSVSQKLSLMSLYQNHQVIVVENNEPDKGRLHSIRLGLKKLVNQPTFIQNVDNPFVTVELIQKLIPILQPNTYVSPYYNGIGGHPILISNEIANQLKDCDSDIPLNLFLANYEQIKMEQNNSGILVNINTLDDYRSAFK